MALELEIFLSILKLVPSKVVKSKKKFKYLEKLSSFIYLFLKSSLSVI